MGLGLAIGMDAMRACKTAQWWRGFFLRWRGAAPLPRELLTPSASHENIVSVARFNGLVTEIFRDPWFSRKVQVGLPDTSVRVRLLFTDSLPENPADRRKYLLWRMADALDVRPDRTRLASMAFPSPLPGRGHAVLCAVSADKVIEQYERALAESKVRSSSIAPSSMLLFNLFHHHLIGPPGVPLLFLAAAEASLTTIVVLDGAPIFWRTRRLFRPGEQAPAAGTYPAAELLRDVVEAIAYCGDELDVEPPAEVFVAGPLAGEPGLADWLAGQLQLPVTLLDAGRLVRHTPERLAEGWNRWGVALGAAARR